MRLTAAIVPVASLTVFWCTLAFAQQPVNVPVTVSNDDFGGPQVSSSGVGYIDSAILGDQLRFRFDATYDNVEPARTEFFWPVDGPFGPGPGPETRADYQDLSLYGERRFAENWSVFGELPVRFLNPEIQDNTAGIGDIQAGFKHLMQGCCDHALTFQLRAYVPTADGTRGLGTRHVSLEPALLWYRQHTEHFALNAELRDWISIGGSDPFAGNVLRYGLGGTYTFDPCACRPLSLVVEMVGWTVLEGMTAITTPPTTQFTDATGDTIVNAKIGLRYQMNPQDSLYAGYGHALTSETWYSDVFRFEFRRSF